MTRQERNRKRMERKYNDQLAIIGRYMAKIGEGLSEHGPAEWNNWGCVGDLEKVTYDLKQASDFLHGEGEHAE